MKHLTDFINEKLIEPKMEDAIAFPEQADIVKISPNDYEGSLAFMTYAEAKEEGVSEKLLKLKPWESVVIDEDIYVVITDLSALDEK